MRHSTTLWTPKVSRKRVSPPFHTVKTHEQSHAAHDWAAGDEPCLAPALCCKVQRSEVLVALAARVHVLSRPTHSHAQCGVAPATCTDGARVSGRGCCDGSGAGGAPQSPRGQTPCRRRRPAGTLPTACAGQSPWWGPTRLRTPSLPADAPECCPCQPVGPSRRVLRGCCAGAARAGANLGGRERLARGQNVEHRAVLAQKFAELGRVRDLERAGVLLGNTRARSVRCVGAGPEGAFRALWQCTGRRGTCAKIEAYGSFSATPFFRASACFRACRVRHTR